jgi:molybdopterin converting factor small subunit
VREDLTRDALKAEKIVEKIRKIHLQVQETLKKLQQKYKARHDQHITERTSRVGDKVWLQLNNERLQGLGKKIKAMWYGPFKVLEKVEDNSY